jgi:hypothetical protein
MAYYPILSLANFYVLVLQGAFFIIIFLCLAVGLQDLDLRSCHWDLDLDSGLVLGLPDSAEMELELQG